MLKIEQLDVKERSGRYLLKDISMEIPAGHVIGLTGKSGSGKTTLLRSILGMLHTSCHIDAGKILLDDIDLSHLSRKSHRELCGKKLGFIPQNPMTAFDSRLKIGYQMRETFVNRLHLNTSEATDLAKEKLVSVNSRKQHYRFCRSQWRRQVYHYEADCGILGCNKRNCQVRRNRYSQNSVVTAYG